MPWFIQLIMAIFMIILYIAIFMGMYTSSSYSDKRTFSPKAVGIILDTLNRTYPYGYITEFLSDSQFISYNTGPCGNECRILSKGTYTLTQNTITLFVKSLSYAKDCQDRPSEEINTSLGMYRWEQKNSRLILTPLMP